MSANSQEDAPGLTEIVPFLVEDELKALGGIYARGPDWRDYLLQDGRDGAGADRRAGLIALRAA